MTAQLPPNLLLLFAPRDPIPYLPPLDKSSDEKQPTAYTPIGSYVQFFEDPKDMPPPVKLPTKQEKATQNKQEKQEQAAYKLEQEIATWESKHTGDPFKTIFVARINYETTESKLRREFEVYGTIRRISLVCNVKSGKPRGYGFIEYKHERDMRAAYKQADGKKIDGRRVLVDFVRGGTVSGWLPRRLGGGLGNSRCAQNEGERVERSEEGATRRSERRGKSRDRESGVRRKRSRSREGDRKRRGSRSPSRRDKKR